MKNPRFFTYRPTGSPRIPAPLEIQPADRSEPGFSSFLGPREDKIFSIRFQLQKQNAFLELPRKSWKRVFGLDAARAFPLREIAKS